MLVAMQMHQHGPQPYGPWGHVGYNGGPGLAPRQPSAAVKVFGILSICFAALNGLGNAMSVAQGLLQREVSRSPA